MKYIYMLAVFAFAFILPCMPANAAITTVFYPVEDTYTSYPVDSTAACGQDGNITIAHGSEDHLTPYCNSTAENFKAMIKYNISEALSKIITAGVFNFYVKNNSCLSYLTVNTSDNISWTEADVMQNLSSTGSLGKATVNGVGLKGISIANIGENISALYKLPNYDYSAFQIDGTATCGSNFINLSSREDTGQAANYNFNLTYTDYATSLGTFAIGFFTRTVYYDFESQAGSFAYTPYADFSYNIDTNILTPINGNSMLPMISEYNRDNNLNMLTCNGQSGYSGAALASINFPVGNYWNICFNLSSQHGGRKFYGGIKVINNTNNAFIFYAAQYSPDYTTFSLPVVYPASPRGSQQVNISYTSTQALTTGIKFYYVYGNTTSPLATIENTSSYDTSHIAKIPASDVVQFATYYYYLFGSTAGGSAFYSPTYNFSTGISIGVQTINEKYTSNENYSDAFVLIPIDTAGYPTGLEMDCKITTANGFTRGYIPAQEKYYVENLNVTAAAWLIYAGSGVIGQTWNVSCISYSNLLANETHASVYIDQLPKITQLVIQPGEACTPVLYGFSQSNCENYMKLKNVSFYCAFDANQCQTYDSQSGKCIKYGTWTGYQCTSCSKVPIGFTCNGSTSPGQQINGTSDINDLIGTSLGSIFKINSAAALGFIACMVFFLVGMAAGVWAKNGSVIILGLLSGMLGFWFLGWLPIWIPIILGLISAFLVAKFIVNAISPQSSGG